MTDRGFTSDSPISYSATLSENLIPKRDMQRKTLIRIVALFGPMLIVTGVVLAVETWDRGALPWNRPPIVDVDWFDLHVENRGVRVNGVVHLSSGFELQQRRGGCAGEEDEFRAYLYPFFHEEGWSDREIRVLLYTTEPPENENIDIEARTIEGYLRPLGPDRWDPRIQVALEERGYALPQPVEQHILLIEEFVD